MTLTIELTPQEEARLAAAAQQKGLAPADFVKKLVTEHLPPVLEVSVAETGGENDIHQLIDEGGVLVLASPPLLEVDWESLLEQERATRIDSFEFQHV